MKAGLLGTGPVSKLPTWEMLATYSSGAGAVVIFVCLLVQAGWPRAMSPKEIGCCNAN